MPQTCGLRKIFKTLRNCFRNFTDPPTDIDAMVEITEKVVAMAKIPPKKVIGSLKFLNQWSLWPKL